MSTALTFICAAAGLLALLAAIGLLLGPSRPSEEHGGRDPALRTPRRTSRGRRRTERRARALSAVEATHVRDLSTTSDGANGAE